MHIITSATHPAPPIAVRSRGRFLAAMRPPPPAGPEDYVSRAFGADLVGVEARFHEITDDIVRGAPREPRREKHT